MCCQQDIAEELHEADPMRGLSESLKDLKAFKEIQVICCPVVQVICFLKLMLCGCLWMFVE